MQFELIQIVVLFFLLFNLDDIFFINSLYLPLIVFIELHEGIPNTLYGFIRKSL